MATEEFYFSCAIRFKNVFATGNVVFRDNEFSGAFAYNYLEGLLTDGTLEFNLYEAIGLNNTIFENPTYVFLNAEGYIEELEVPQKYQLKTQDGSDFSIEFLDIIKNPKKQKEILEEIQNAFTLRTI